MTANLSYFNENGSFVSALGHSQRFDQLPVTSGLLRTSDMVRSSLSRPPRWRRVTRGKLPLP